MVGGKVEKELHERGAIVQQPGIAKNDGAGRS